MTTITDVNELITSISEKTGVECIQFEVNYDDLNALCFDIKAKSGTYRMFAGLAFVSGNGTSGKGIVVFRKKDGVTSASIILM